MKVDRVINQAIWEHQANTKGFPNYEYLNGLEKLRKALEIIVRKKVNMQLLIESIDLDFYNSHWFMRLCQEEFDLLKEVLL